ncbi:MAG: hypothetical protein R3C44_09530 [Chloroflexota bacterium]
MEYEDGAVDFIRIPLSSARFHADYGLKRSKWPPSDSQVNILSREWLDSVGKLAIHGRLAVRRTTDCCRVAVHRPWFPVPVSDSGKSAVVEITKPRSGCSRLEAAQGQSIAGIGGIGLLARVITSGDIRVGDPVVVVTGWSGCSHAVSYS